MASTAWLTDLYERIGLIVIQVLLEYYQYRKYKRQVPKEDQTYKKYLKSCFKESVFNENFVHYPRKLSSLIEQNNFYSRQNQNQYEDQQGLNFNYRQMKNIIQIDEVFDSQLESSQKLIANKNNINHSLNGSILKQDNQESIQNNNEGQKYFYIFHFAIFLCLPSSLVTLFLSYDLQNSSIQDVSYQVKQYFCSLFGNLENVLDYFCYYFVALMIQNQGIFVKLNQDSYQQQRSQISILIKCQLLRALMFVTIIFVIQQIINISFILSDKLEVVDLIPLFYYTIIFYSFYYSGYFTYSNKKLQKDQILATYYRNFYKKHFNYQDLFQEFKKIHSKQQDQDLSKENFKQFLKTKMHLSLQELEIKQKKLEQNEQFRDLVYNQGIPFQLLIKSLYFFLVIILPTFMLSMFIWKICCFWSDQNQQVEYSYQKLLNLVQYYLSDKNFSSINGLQQSLAYKGITMTYNIFCYLLLFGLKYFTKQRVFFNATAFKVN
ncbi:hypothetical protein ABPG74_005975 [Tetrahymena malaccensis]